MELGMCPAIAADSWEWENSRWRIIRGGSESYTQLIYQHAEMIKICIYIASHWHTSSGLTCATVLHTPTLCHIPTVILVRNTPQWDTGTGDRKMPFDREFILGHLIVIFFKNQKSGHLIEHDQASAFVRNFSHFCQGTKPNYMIKRPAFALSI